MNLAEKEDEKDWNSVVNIERSHPGLRKLFFFPVIPSTILLFVSGTNVVFTGLLLEMSLLTFFFSLFFLLYTTVVIQKQGVAMV